MTPSIARRLNRLEVTMRPPTGVRALRLLTDDELEARIITLSRCVPGDPSFTVTEQEEAAQRVAAFDAANRAKSASQPGAVP